MHKTYLQWDKNNRHNLHPGSLHLQRMDGNAPVERRQQVSFVRIAEQRNRSLYRPVSGNVNVEQKLPGNSVRSAELQSQQRMDGLAAAEK